MHARFVERRIGNGTKKALEVTPEAGMSYFNEILENLSGERLVFKGMRTHTQSYLFGL